MKKLIYLFTAALIVSTFSFCSKDDDGGSTPVDKLFGKWFLKELTMEGSFEEEGTVITYTAKSLNISEGNFIIFKEDQTFEAQSTPFDLEMKMNFMGQTITQIVPISSDLPESGTWSESGNSLTINSDTTGESVTYTIESFSNNSITLLGDETTMDMGDDFPETAKFEMRITFKK